MQTQLLGVWTALALFSGMASAETLQVQSGSAAFEVGTTVPAVSVHGKSNALNGHAQVQESPGGLVLEQVEAAVPVQTLNTGMGLRDEHMRKYIFTTPDGKTPDLRFTAQKIACPAGREVVCQVQGNLAIRDIDKPFAVALKVRKDGASAFRAAGDGQVKLSDYGIERPSQFGVKTDDEIKLHLEFTARTGTATAQNRGGKP